MAEFVQVMSQFMRLCDSYENCDNCPVCQAGFYCACDYQGYSKTGAAEVEHIIMEWATDHPEPVYPTWWDWFAAGGLDPDDPIPADIAQKLGIEPKNG